MSRTWTLALLFALVGAGCAGPGAGDAAGDAAGADGHDHGSHDHGFPTDLHRVPTTVSEGPKADGNPGGADGADGSGGTDGAGHADGNGTAGDGNGTAEPTATRAPRPTETPSPGPTDPDDPGPGPKRDPVTWVVTIRDGAFENASLTVQIHDAVRWVHDDGSEHTVTADDLEFDSGYVHEGPMSRGDVYEKEFDVTGHFPYHCSLHPSMTGSVWVRERSDATPASDA